MAENTQQNTGSQQPAQVQKDDDKKTQEMANKVGSFFKEGAQRTGTGVRLVWHNPLMFVKVLDRMIDWARRVIPQELFNVISRFLARVGYVSLLVAAPVGLVFGITAGIKEERFSIALAGLAFALLMLIIQYAANKLLTAGETLTLASPTVMESDAFLRCVALISKITAIVVLISMTVIAIQNDNWSTFWTGVGAYLLLVALSFIAIHPALASTSVVERSSTSAGEEAIGIVSFFVKAFMRIVPIIFGVTAFAALVLLVIATFQQFRDRASLADGMATSRMLIQTALLPLAAYVGFALFCLQVELLRAILSIKGIAKKYGE